MGLREYGLGDTTDFVRSIPRATIAPVIDGIPPRCPNCLCETLCEIQIDVEAPMLRGHKGTGKYLGCPACPWASPMIMVADVVKEGS